MVHFRLLAEVNNKSDTTFVLSKHRSNPVRRMVAVLIASCLIAGLVTGYYWDRSRQIMIKVMAETGNALLIAMESGIKSRNRFPDGIRFQSLIEELVGKISVKFIAMTTQEGLILAHSNHLRVGSYLSDSAGSWIVPGQFDGFAPTQEAQWVFADMEEGHAFVVYRLINTGRKLGTHRNVCIFLGMSTEPFIKAQNHDRRIALAYGGSVLAFGFVLALCLYAWQRLWASRRRQRETEALVDELALTVPDGLILFDARGHLIGMNTAAINLLYLTDIRPGQRYGESVLARMPESLRDQIDFLKKNKILPDTELVLDFEEKSVPISVRGGQIGNSLEPIGYLLLLRDISEVRRLEAEIRRREKLAAIGNLAAGVAHELRNPLSSIKGYATYFSERFPEGSDEREAARVMVNETERLNRTISELISLARPMTVTRRPSDLAELVTDIVHLISQDTAVHHIDVHLSVAEKLPLVFIDPDRIRQVVLNLCLNAVDAMSGGGTLDISIVHNERLNNEILEIKDTGDGISADDLPHIFDPYFTTKGHGTGLGLAIVHKIMEAHDGLVEVVSTQGAGTVFRLIFSLNIQHTDSDTVL